MSQAPYATKCGLEFRLKQTAIVTFCQGGRIHSNEMVESIRSAFKRLDSGAAVLREYNAAGQGIQGSLTELRGYRTNNGPHHAENTGHSNITFDPI